uniref:Chloride channel protein n=1 Tax=Haemonchus contortus TaxID=6289 RepID=A0A7I4Y3S6_HAECO
FKAHNHFVVHFLCGEMNDNGYVATDVERNMKCGISVSNGGYEINGVSNGGYGINGKIGADEEKTTKAIRFSLHPTLTEIRTSDDSKSKRIRGGKYRYQYGSIRMLISDWLFLAILGVLVAFLSIFVDMMVYYFQQVQSLTFPPRRKDMTLPFFTWLLSFSSWCTYTVGMVSLAATFVHYVSPQAIGSGISEMKTVIRGVILKDYLTFKTLASKTFGVALALGSGIPIGKMGPFVHIASATANQLSRFASRFDPAFKNETRRAECLAAACAVGVACTFSAPVGGVLFSIEVTTMYFSVRSYWRGFFAACCGAVTIRLLRGFVVQTEVTVNAFFQTSFAPDAFVVKEIPLFVVLGVICGALGALYISFYRTVVLFLRNNERAKALFQRHWIVYPMFVSLVYSIISFPHGLGQFSSGRLKFGMNLKDFFTNCTFSEDPPSFLACNRDDFDHWMDNRESVIALLVIFIIVHFVFSVVCMTLPVPSGVFMPIFVLGAAIGRLMGEIVAIALPSGVIEGLNIYPGVYAVVGAASFSASVTHTVSVSVMIFEITGQLHYILPVMISVLLSNAVCAYMQPSFFDTIIKIKHLPFLPDIPPSNNLVHTLRAEDIMISPVLYTTRIISYATIQQILLDDRNLRIFPVVDSETNQTLIGTITRDQLMSLLHLQIGDSARKEEAARRVGKAVETIDLHFRSYMSEALKNQRAKSESSLPYKISERVPYTLQKELSKPRHTLTPVQREHRFAITKVIEPPIPRRNSLTRRNAVCSLEPSKSDATVSNEDTKTSSSNEENVPDRHLSLHSVSDYHALVKGYMKQAKKCLNYINFGSSKQYKVPENWYDLSPEERRQWEKDRLSEEVDLSSDLDPAPFHLVKKTSLYKIHSIFSMLQLSKAYVTEGGRLIGVVALSDVRRELERSQERARRGSHVTPLQQKTSTASERSSAQVFDILTPTLEVVRPTAPTHSTEQDNISVHSRRQSTQSNQSSKAWRKSFSTYVAHENGDEHTALSEKQRATNGGHRHDEFEEAVAYLRRKSLKPDDRKISSRKRTIEKFEK